MWFIVILIVFVGPLYLFYRYRSISRKKVFFASPLFRGLAGSAIILVSSILLVNIFFPEKIFHQSFGETRSELSDTEKDTSIHFLSSQEPEFHYKLLARLSDDTAFQKQLSAHIYSYERMTFSSDQRTAAIGNFFLGISSLSDVRYQDAASFFDKISDTNFPYLHYCYGKLLQHDSLDERAEAEYFRELQVPSGNHRESIRNLVVLLSSATSYSLAANDYNRLYKLFDNELTDEEMNWNLKRRVLIINADIEKYTVLLLSNTMSTIGAIGFIAALLIASVWATFLIKIDIFSRHKWPLYFIAFISGMLFTNLVFPITDIASIYLDTRMTGEFFHDMLYAIFMIGIPEEVVKIIPVIVLVYIFGLAKDPLDYVVLGCFSALGFAFLENMMYFQELRSGIIHGRAFFSAIGHMIFSSVATYAFVYARFRVADPLNKVWVIAAGLMGAAIVHGFFDLFLFQGMVLTFFVFFVFIVQCWIIILNNCLNNASAFLYRLVPMAEGSKRFIAISLTLIFCFEYIVVASIEGSEPANIQLAVNSSFAGFFIIFFSGNLSSFDLIKGYWRGIHFMSREKRGYGTRSSLSPLVSWYFLNSLNPNNYVGMRVYLYNEPHNKILTDYLDGQLEGKIVDRVKLYDDGIADPYWFIVKMKEPIQFLTESRSYVLVKLRYQEDSLLYDEEVEVFFRAIPSINLLKVAKPVKDQFPFFGWAVMKIDESVSPPLDVRHHQMSGSSAPTV
jgi:RsiW-degrading membrane proteinase PrsW (M82 family)